MMGVYIPNMEMPENCGDCPFYVEAMPEFEWDDWCHVLQRTLGRGTEKDIDGYDCPLVPVPPHGRLIDADALKDMMIDALNDALPECRTDQYRKIMRDTTMAFIQDIDECPTIVPTDPAEEGET